MLEPYEYYTYVKRTDLLDDFLKVHCDNRHMCIKIVGGNRAELASRVLFSPVIRKRSILHSVSALKDLRSNLIAIVFLKVCLLTY